MLSVPAANHARNQGEGKAPLAAMKLSCRPAAAHEIQAYLLPHELPQMKPR